MSWPWTAPRRRTSSSIRNSPPSRTAPSSCSTSASKCSQVRPPANLNSLGRSIVRALDGEQLRAKTPYAEMHKVERSNLLYCMENLPDLEMRVGWTPTERAKINHPTSMAQKLREFLNRAPTEAPRRNVSPMALLKDKNDQLQRANLDLSERLASAEAREAGGSLFDLARDNVDDIARVIVSTVGVNKARSLHHSLGQAIASTPKP